jgi:hypothetical protein
MRQRDPVELSDAPAAWRRDAVSLCRIVVHDKLVALAEAIFATRDIRVYASELWAKYTGAASYEQEHHRDYLNHTPLVPSADWR